MVSKVFRSCLSHQINIKAGFFWLVHASCRVDYIDLDLRFLYGSVCASRWMCQCSMDLDLIILLVFHNACLCESVSSLSLSLSHTHTHTIYLSASPLSPPIHPPLRIHLTNESPYDVIHFKNCFLLYTNVHVSS